MLGRLTSVVLYKLEEEWGGVVLIPRNQLENGKLSNLFFREFVDKQKFGIKPIF